MNRRTFIKISSSLMVGFLIFRRFSWRKAIAQASGIRPKVLRVYHANATDWDFKISMTPGERYWEHVDVNTCRTMIDEGLKLFSGKTTLEDVWDWVFRRNGGGGYIKGQKIAIKLNWNDCDPGLGDGPDGNWLVSNVQVVQALIESMLDHIPGLKPGHLLVGDPSRTPYERIRLALFRLGVRVIEFKPDIFTASPAALVDYPDWQKDYVCDAMFGQSAHLIEMPLLKAISPDLGISGALKDAQGKVGLSNESYSGNRKGWIKKHKTFSMFDKLNNIVYMNSHPWVKNKRRLIIADGIYGLYNGQHFHIGPKDDIPRPWILFGNASPNSLLFSTDPVAVDCVMHDLVRFERMHQELPGSFLMPVKFMKPIQLACATNGLGINDDPIESKVTPSPTGPTFSYPVIDYRVIDVTSR